MEIEKIEKHNRSFWKTRRYKRKPGKKHKLAGIIVMGIYAIICGNTDSENIEDWLSLRKEYFDFALKDKEESKKILKFETEGFGHGRTGTRRYYAGKDIEFLYISDRIILFFKINNNQFFIQKLFVVTFCVI